MHDRARPALRGAEAENRLDAVTERLLAMHPVGDPDTCVRRLVRTLRTSGCTRVLCQVEGDPTTDAVLRNLGRLPAEVFPEVRSRIAADVTPAAVCPGPRTAATAGEPISPQ